MGSGGAYSGFIRLVKVVLPVTALSLLAVLFLLARAPTGDGELPFARIEIETTDEQLLSPVISGVGPNGDKIRLTASRIQLFDQGGQASDLALRVDGADGGWVLVEAGSAQVDQSGTQVQISNLARIDSSAGYRVETVGFGANLDTGAMQTDGALEIRAPFGQLTAQQMRVEPSTDSAMLRLVFHGGVRLVYSPQPPDGDKQ